MSTGPHRPSPGCAGGAPEPQRPEDGRTGKVSSSCATHVLRPLPRHVPGPWNDLPAPAVSSACHLPALPLHRLFPVSLDLASSGPRVTLSSHHFPRAAEPLSLLDSFLLMPRLSASPASAGPCPSSPLCPRRRGQSPTPGAL